MHIEKKRDAYWRRNLGLTVGLLLLWCLVTFVAPFYARELNAFKLLGFPLGFYMAAQGALIVYVLIIWYYARSMNRLDREFGVNEGERD